MVNFAQKFTPDPVGILPPLIAFTKKEAGKEVANAGAQSKIKRTQK